MRRMKAAAILGSILGLPLLVTAALVLLTAAPARVQAAGDPPGKAIFLAQKCSMCHSIASQGIEATTKSEKMKGPDLSNAGAHPAAWITQWLKKEVAAADGKKHTKTWAGTDDELKQLVDWLGTLKKA